jgi:hypothetical protein
MSNSRDLGSGVGACGVGCVPGVRSVTFPSTLATPPAPLPSELLVQRLSCPGGPTERASGYDPEECRFDSCSGCATISSSAAEHLSYKQWRGGSSPS